MYPLKKMNLKKSKKLLFSSNVIHFIFWLIVTTIFIYDRRYLIMKYQLPEHFLACVAVRMSLLISLVYFHLEVLIPRFFEKGRFLFYSLGLFASLLAYVCLQNLYDVYLYGFVIGDVMKRDFWSAFPYNFITTLWYVALTTGLKYSLDRLIKRKEIELTKNNLIPEEESMNERQVFLKTGTKQVMTDLNAVTHIKGLKDYSIVFTDENDQIIVKGSLKNKENLLGERKLIRVHKSYLVALDRIKTIQHNQIILGNHAIPIGRSYKKDLYAMLDLV